MHLAHLNLPYIALVWDNPLMPRKKRETKDSEQPLEPQAAKLFSDNSSSLENESLFAVPDEGKVRLGAGEAAEDEKVQELSEETGPELFGAASLDDSALLVSARSEKRKGYVVLARRYRPQTFDDLVGQEHVREALRRAILEGEVAHAYLFSGPRGTGKTSTARILAKSLNCQESGPRPDPCGRCASCRAIAAGSSLDVIEIDAASNTGVDNIRDLRAGVVLAPFFRYKVYIIDEVHMLSMQAFNALLKTLEEPPPRVIFVMATTELHKVPPTIISRCQCFQFKRFTTQQIVEHLDRILEKEAAERGIAVNPGEKRRILELIAQTAEGGMRDAQVALDQILVLCRERLDYETVRRFLGGVQSSVVEKFVRAIFERKTDELLLLLDEVVSVGMDLERFVKNTAEYLRNLLIVRQVGKESALLDYPEDKLATMEKVAQECSISRLVNLCNSFIELVDKVKTMSAARFLLELEIVRLTCLDPEDDLSKLVQALKSLEKGSAWRGGSVGSFTALAANATPASVSASIPASVPELSPSVRARRATVSEAPRDLPSERTIDREPDVPATSQASRPLLASEDEPRLVVEDGPLPPELVERLCAAATQKPLNLVLPRVRAWILSGSFLVLRVDPAERFDFDVLNRPNNQKILIGYFRRLTGRVVELRIEHDSPGTQEEPDRVSENLRAKADLEMREERSEEAAQFVQHKDQLLAARKEEEGAQIESDDEADHREDVSENLEDQPLDEILDVERIRRQYQPALKGKKLKTFLQDKPVVAEIIEQFKQVFGVGDDAFSFKPHQVED
jgi:DNA polymerase-3 subunit gamma/tau